MGQSLRVAFNEIHEVKHVPGVPKDRNPGFFERYLYWRQCCLVSASVFGMFLLASCLSKDGSRLRDLDKEFEQFPFPAQFKDHLRYFVYLNLAMSLFNTGVTVVTVFLLWAACCWQKQFKVSVVKERQAWGLLILGPFVPFVLAPVGASLRTDLLQRDMCAVTLAGLLKNSWVRTSFLNAARHVGEPELSVISLFPAPKFHTMEWETWEGLTWCEERHKTWEKVLFSSEWVKAAYTNFTDPRMTLPMPLETEYPGVIPQTFREMMGMINVLVDPVMRFCYNDYLLKAQAIKDLFGAHNAKGKFMQESDAGGFAGFDALDDLDPFAYAGQGNGTWRRSAHSTATVAVDSHGNIRPEPHRKPKVAPKGRGRRHRSQDKPKALVRRASKDGDGFVAAADLHRHAKGHLIKKAQRASRKRRIARHAPGGEIASMFDGAFIESDIVNQTLVARRAPGSGMPSAFGGALVETEPLNLTALYEEGALGEQDTGTELTKPLSTVTKLALQGICMAFRGAITLLRVARMSNLMTVRLVGVLGAQKCVQLLALSIFSVVDGLVAGVVNAKKVIPTSSLPGHLLTVAVLTSLPPILLFLAVLSQVFAHVLFSLACGCLAIWRLIDILRANKMIQTNRPKQAMEEFDKLTGWQIRAQILFLVFLIAYVLRLIYQIKDGNLMADVGMTSLFDGISIRDLLEPIGLLMTLSRVLMVRVLTLLVTTDLVVESIFDSADDTLKGRGCENEDIVNGWRRLNGKKLFVREVAVRVEEADITGPAGPQEPQERPPLSFQVYIMKRKGAKMGIVCGVHAEYLEIEEITGGLVGEWNLDHPDQEIKEGDYIMGVNEESGVGEEIRTKMKDDENLNLTIKRVFKPGDPGPPPPGPPAPGNNPAFSGAPSPGGYPAMPRPPGPGGMPGGMAMPRPPYPVGYPAMPRPPAPAS